MHRSTNLPQNSLSFVKPEITEWILKNCTIISNRARAEKEEGRERGEGRKREEGKRIKRRNKGVREEE